MPSQIIQAFKGLNNTADPLRVGLEWLSQADNVNVTDTGAIVKRAGYTRTQTGAFTSAYSTQDHSRLYAVADSTLVAVTSHTTRVAIAPLTSAAPMYWAEVNGQVFFNNGADCGIVLPDNTVLDWRWPLPAPPALVPVTGTLAPGLWQVRCTYTLPDGRETGASDSAEIILTDGQALQITVPQAAGCTTNVYLCPPGSTVYQLGFTTTRTAETWNASHDTLGADLLTAFLDPLPQGCGAIQFFKGRLYAAMYMPTQDQTVVWFSEPLGFHLFNLLSSFIMVPGQVHMLAAVDAALIIGTGSSVYAYDGEKLAEIAPYGVVPGQHWAQDDGRIIFWTTRGACAALPFTNLTEHAVSVAPGVQAGGTVMHSGGQTRYVVALHQGGSAFNDF